MGALMPNPDKKPGRRRRGRPSKVQAQGDIALLDAAQSAFARYGFEGATLRGVAAAAGVDPALHHVLDHLVVRTAPDLARRLGTVQ